jgi:uncharacterized DUF497 family protein
MYKYGNVEEELFFEWDISKEISNIRKHKISFLEAVETFYDTNGLQMDDIKHSNRKELRYYWIGKNKAEEVLTTYFTLRGNKIRIIGCAKLRKFKRIYDENTQNK